MPFRALLLPYFPRHPAALFYAYRAHFPRESSPLEQQISPPRSLDHRNTYIVRFVNLHE